jgi:predicted nicotinamide N-methyase
VVCLNAWIWDKKHRALLTTCERSIVPGGCVLVFYTHHRPHLAQRDMEFFEMARESRWECEKILTERFPVRVMLFCAEVSPLAE